MEKGYEMKILIADDSNHKIEEVKVLLFDRLDIDPQDVFVTMSFKETIKEITRVNYDLVILDMSMPSSSGSLSRSSRTLAGKDVLATVSYRQIIGVKFVLFSQFSEFGRHDDVVSLSDIYDSLADEYGDYLLGFVKYENSSSSWKDKLESIIKTL